MRNVLLTIWCKGFLVASAASKCNHYAFSFWNAGTETKRARTQHCASEHQVRSAAQELTSTMGYSETKFTGRTRVPAIRSGVAYPGKRGHENSNRRKKLQLPVHE